MIDQVGRDVEQDPTTRPNALAPSSSLQIRPETIIICFEANNSPEGPVRNNLSNGLKISVVSPVLINSNQSSRFTRQLNELCSFRQCRGERFVHHYVAPSLQALPGNRRMSLVRRGDHHKSNLADIQKFLDAAHYSNIRILFSRFVSVALQNRSQPQPWRGANHLSMKCTARQTKPDQPDINHGISFQYKFYFTDS